MYTLYYEDFDGGIRELAQFSDIASAQLFAEEWVGRWGTNEEQMFALNEGLTLQFPDGNVFGDVVSESLTFLHFG